MQAESIACDEIQMPQSMGQKLIFYSLEWLAAFISWLPAGFITRFCRFLSWLSFDVFRLRRRLLLKNLQIAFPEGVASFDSHTQLARESVYQFLLTVFEVLRSKRYPLAAHINIVGEQYLVQALQEESKGAYILGCHLGNWEALGAAVNRFIGPCYITVKKVGGEGVNRFVETMRARNGFRWLHREQDGDAVRQIKRILANANMVGFVYDQARPGEPRLPFFGVSAKTNTSLMALWHRRPAPVVPVFIERICFGVHQVVCLPPVSLQRSRPPSESILRTSTQLNTIVEHIIRRRPEQYFWFHNRWK